MQVPTAQIPRSKVAPVRERGLKYAYNAQPIDENGRSREGAWIEMAVWF